MAELLLTQLYPGKKVEDLNESQKQTISALTTMAGSLAGSLAGGDSAGALAGAQTAKNEVENNTLKPKEIDALGRKLATQSGGKQGAAKSLCENDLIKVAVQESDRRNNFSPEYQKAFNTAFNNAMSSVSSICKADSQCVTEVANSLLQARLTCNTVECANDMAGGAIRNAAVRYGGVLDIVKIAVGDFGWLIGLKGPKAITPEGTAKSGSLVVDTVTPSGTVLVPGSGIKPAITQGGTVELFTDASGAKVPGAVAVGPTTPNAVGSNAMRMPNIPSNSQATVVANNLFIPPNAGGTGSMMDYLPEAARITQPGGEIIINGTPANKYLTNMPTQVQLDVLGLSVKYQGPLLPQFQGMTFLRTDGSVLTAPMKSVVLVKKP
ncbi:MULTISPECIES: VENN motif pre-toxin domain-containing protein [Chromobacterium]|uniref:VENN motif pre-toxin domain-containing protein n=1 Tax=Chromobacterium TaxID=535 RepID=UPI002714D509|nr:MULTISPECIES: VENN motif pre-toxin domain-containing protein [Chromobacterium]